MKETFFRAKKEKEQEKDLKKNFIERNKEIKNVW